MVEGMDPLSLVLVPRLKPMRLGNEVKSKWESVPSNSVSKRFIIETFLVVSQALPFQLQRFPMLLRDHDELREEDEGRNLISTRWRWRWREGGDKTSFLKKIKFLGGSIR